MKRGKNLFRILLAMVLLTTINLTTFGKGAGVVSQYGRLQVYGSHVCSESGQQITLGGLSHFWSNWDNGFYSGGTVSDLANNWDCSIVRAAAGVAYCPESTGHNTVAAPGGILDWNYDGTKQQVVNVIEAAIANDIYVIVDWHIEGKADKESWWLGEAKKFFREIAQAYGNYPHIIYELYNEPSHDGNDAGFVSWWCQELRNEIRTYDADNLVIVGSPDWSQQPNNVGITDNNVAYTFHAYPDAPYGGAHMDAFYANVPAAMNQGKAVFVTEYGAQGGAHSRTDEFISKCQEWGISMCAWAIHNVTSDQNSSWSIFNEGGGITTVGNYYKNKLHSWPGSNPDDCANAPAFPVGSTIQAEDYCASNNIQVGTDCGSYVGWIQDDSWMAYKINVPAAGTYKITYNVASLSGNGSFKFEEKGGGTTYGTINVSPTGSWCTWTEVSQDVVLPAGDQQVAIAAISAGWNLDWFKIEPIGTGYLLNVTVVGSGSVSLDPNKASYNPGEVVKVTPNPGSGASFQGWSGDESGSANPLWVTMNGNKNITATFTGGTGTSFTLQAEDFDYTGGVQIINGWYIGYIDNGDWIAFDNVNVPLSGTYNVTYRVAAEWGGGTIKCEQNSGSTLLGQVSFSPTNGWEDWKEVTHTVKLDGGTQNFGFGFVNGPFNVDWIKFTRTGPKSAMLLSELEEATEVEFSIYPNPANEVLNIELSNVEENSTVEVFDLFGKQVMKVNASQSKTQIDISELKTGMYIVKNNSSAKRFVKK